jgi:hypothetical protein
VDGAHPALGGVVVTAPGAAAIVLAAALLVTGGRLGRARLRDLSRPDTPAPVLATVRPEWVALAGSASGAAAWAAAGTAAVAVAAAVAGLVVALLLRRLPRPPQGIDHPADLAAAWEQLAVCLEVGLPVAAAVSAAAEPLDGQAGGALRRVAGLLELGADPDDAWSGVRDPPLAAFARAAARSAGTGAALARAARTEAARLRDGLGDAAEARAHRAAVLITAPLGLCFLPAFLAVGIAPVVIGLARTALAPW